MFVLLIHCPIHMRQTVLCDVSGHRAACLPCPDGAPYISHTSAQYNTGRHRTDASGRKAAGNKHAVGVKVEQRGAMWDAMDTRGWA